MQTWKKKCDVHLLRFTLAICSAVVAVFQVGAQSDPDPFISDFLSRFGAFPQGPPNDPLFQEQWNLDRIRVDRVWNMTRGQGVTIAVVDTGIDYQHEDLAGNIWINTGEDINRNGRVDPQDFNNLDDDGNGFVDDLQGWNFADHSNDPMDVEGHGTRVAGIIAAQGNNGLGMIGVSPESRIMPLKIIGEGNNVNEDAFVSAYEYAVKMGADIIHNSLAPSSFNVLNPALESAVRHATRNGIIVVFSVSNTGDQVKFYSPQNMLETITVGQSDLLDRKTLVSQFGEFIDVLAPGVGIPTTALHHQYETVTAPSYAAPHVTGLAALILSANRDLKSEEVRSLIRSGADDIIPFGYDLDSGFGRINAEASLRIGEPIEVAIDSPINYSFIPGDQKELDITGSVAGEDLLFHMLYFSDQVEPRQWQPIRAPDNRNIHHGILGTLPLANLNPGNYWIRLQALSRRGHQFNHYVQVALEGSSKRVSPESRFQSRPDLSNHHLVWEDNHSGTPQVLLYDVFKNNVIPINEQDSVQFWPAVSGNHVIWEGRSFGNPDVYYKNLEEGTSRRIPNEIADQFEADISGTRIVWTDYRKSNANIYLYDLKENREYAITRNPEAQFAPEIDGDRIVWMDFRNRNWDIYMTDLADCPVPDRCPVIQITRDEAAQTAPEISGDHIVWTDFRDGAPQIYLYDLKDHREIQITDAAGFRSRPVISGNRIAWQDFRNRNWDIFYYDLNTGLEHGLVTDSGDQTEPALSGRYLAWTDHRFLHWHIYLHEFPEANLPPILQLDQTNHDLEVGTLYVLDFQAHDPDNEPVIDVKISPGDVSSDLPEGIALRRLDESNFRLSWRPLRHQVGEFSLLLSAFDGREASTLTVQLNVTDPAELDLSSILNDRRDFKVGETALGFFLLTNSGTSPMQIPVEISMGLFDADHPTATPLQKGRFVPPLLGPGRSSFFGMHFGLKEEGAFLIRARLDDITTEYEINVLP